MTTSCIRISSDILIGKNEDKIFDFLSKNLHQIGVTLESTSVILNLRDSIRKSIMSSSSDCIIIIGENDIESHFAIKNAVCDCFGLTLVKNENLIRFLDNYSKSHTIPTNIKNEYFLPEGASILPNAFDYRQGWFLEDDKIIIYFSYSFWKSLSKHILKETPAQSSFNELILPLKSPLISSVK